MDRSKGRNKVSKIEVNMRVLFCYKCFLAGVTDNQTIRQKLSEKMAELRKNGNPKGLDERLFNWGNVADRTLDRYKRRARLMVEEKASVDQDREYARFRERYDELYADCKKNNERNSCIRILKQEAELLGLEKPRRLRIEDSDGKSMGGNIGSSLGLALKAVEDRLKKDDKLREQMEKALTDD